VNENLSIIIVYYCWRHRPIAVKKFGLEILSCFVAVMVKHCWDQMSRPPTILVNYACIQNMTPTIVWSKQYWFESKVFCSWSALENRLVTLSQWNATIFAFSDLQLLNFTLIYSRLCNRFTWRVINCEYYYYYYYIIVIIIVRFWRRDSNLYAYRL